MSGWWNSRRFRKKIKNATSSMGKNKGVVSIIGAWVFVQILSGFIKDLPYATTWMTWVYTTVHQWAPSPNANPLWKLGYANLLFWPLVGVALLIYNLYRWASKRDTVAEEAYEPVTMYRDELAATLVAIDTEQDEQTVVENVEELVDTIFNTVAVRLGLLWKECRMYLVVPKKSDPEETALSGFRKGKFFEDAKRGKVTVDAFNEMISKDRKYISAFQKSADRTEIYGQLKGREETVLLFATNPGKYLRMGLFVVITRKGATTAEFEVEFPKITQIISMIGFVDEIVEVVRQYGQAESGGGDEGE